MCLEEERRAENGEEEAHPAESRAGIEVLQPKAEEGEYDRVVPCLAAEEHGLRREEEARGDERSLGQPPAQDEPEGKEGERSDSGEESAQARGIVPEEANRGGAYVVLELGEPLREQIARQLEAVLVRRGRCG